MEKITLQTSFAAFIRADIGDKEAAHALRLQVVSHHYLMAVKGNATELQAALAEVSTRKEKIAKAYLAGFQATGIPGRAKYDGRCTDDIMQTIVRPAAAAFIAQWERAFLEVCPIKAAELTDAEKADADKAKAEKKAAKLAADAKEAGYIKAEEVTADDAPRLVRMLLPLLQISELQSVETFIGALIDEKTVAAATAQTLANAKADAKADAPKVRRVRKADAKAKADAPKADAKAKADAPKVEEPALAS